MNLMDKLKNLEIGPRNKVDVLCERLERLETGFRVLTEAMTEFDCRLTKVEQSLTIKKKPSKRRRTGTQHNKDTEENKELSFDPNNENQKRIVLYILGHGTLNRELISAALHIKTETVSKTLRGLFNGKTGILKLNPDLRTFSWGVSYSNNKIPTPIRDKEKFKQFKEELKSKELSALFQQAFADYGGIFMKRKHKAKLEDTPEDDDSDLSIEKLEPKQKLRRSQRNRNPNPNYE